MTKHRWKLRSPWMHAHRGCTLTARTYTHGPRRESCNTISADWRPYTMKKHRLASEHTGITDWRLNTLKQQGKKNSRIFSYMPGEQSKIYLSLYASSRWRPIPRRFRDAAVCNVDVHFSTSWWRRAEDLVLHFSQEDQRWLVHLPPSFYIILSYFIWKMQNTDFLKKKV
jgi:hypothetical protein